MRMEWLLTRSERRRPPSEPFREIPAALRRGGWPGRIQSQSMSMQHQKVIENFIREGRGGTGTNVAASEKRFDVPSVLVLVLLIGFSVPLRRASRVPVRDRAAGRRLDAPAVRLSRAAVDAATAGATECLVQSNNVFRGAYEDWTPVDTSKERYEIWQVHKRAGFSDRVGINLVRAGARNWEAILRTMTYAISIPLSIYGLTRIKL